MANTASAKPRQGDQDLASETYVELARAYEALALGPRATFKDHGLTPQQYNVLRVLYVRDPEDQGLACQQISARLIQRLPDLTRLLDRLEAAGWIRRERSQEDRRVVLSFLTESGVARVEAAHPRLLEVHHAQFAHMDEAELHELRRLLRKARGEPPGSGADPPT